MLSLPRKSLCCVRRKHYRAARDMATVDSGDLYEGSTLSADSMMGERNRQRDVEAQHLQRLSAYACISISFPFLKPALTRP